MTYAIARSGRLILDGWAGRSGQRVIVYGETKTAYWIRAITRTRLAGRDRWLDAGGIALVPKTAIRFVEVDA